MFDLNEFSKINKQRCESPEGFNHAIESWSLSDWFTATLGELGEAANVAKKLNRIRDGIPGNGTYTEYELREQLARELADAFIYLDLTAQREGIDLARAVTTTFDSKSKELGCSIMIAPQPDRGVDFAEGDFIQIRHPHGSVGKIIQINDSSPAIIYVEFIYGLDVNGNPMTQRSGVRPIEIRRISKDEYLKIATRRGFATDV